MMLEAFISKYPERRTELEALQVKCQSTELTGEEWNTTKEHVDTIETAFQDYLKERASLSQSFDYWKPYVSDLFPIVRDLTNSLRSGDWILYLSAMERETSRFFLFWENKLLSMDTIISAGLLSTEEEVSTPTTPT